MQDRVGHHVSLTDSVDPKEHVLIFDTTLRDGEQSAGAAMTVEEKVEIAKQLERLGVDVIEAGFPISSTGDFEAVQRIAREVRKPTIAALAHSRGGALTVLARLVSPDGAQRLDVQRSGRECGAAALGRAAP